MVKILIMVKLVRQNGFVLLNTFLIGRPMLLLIYYTAGTTIAGGSGDLRRNLGIKNKKGLIVANYRVEKAGKVKVGIYTGYGALITNVVNEYQKAGVYSKRINLEEMKLPKGVYLIRLSYPEHSERSEERRVGKECR